MSSGKRLGRLEWELEQRVNTCVRQVLTREPTTLKRVVEQVQGLLSPEDLDVLGLQALPRRVRSSLEFLRQARVVRHESRVGWILE